MFSDNLKRRNSGRSPDPKGNSRKILRYDQSSGYTANSHFERVNGSNPSSRRSSMSLQNGAELAGYGTPQSRSPSTRNGYDVPTLNNVEAIPKALESFVLAISNRNQTSQHLSNVQGDFESMAPKHTDFPALRLHFTHRLTQARSDNEAAEAQAATATKLLLDALQGQSSTSHQNCVPRTELDSLKEQLQEMKSENREMKRRLGVVDRRLEDEANSAQRPEQYALNRMTDRMAKIEEVNRATSSTISSAVQNHKALQDQTVKDRLSFRTRCSALEDYMEKNKAKHKENAQAISSIQTTLDDHIGKSDGEHKEHTSKIELFKADVNTLQRTLDLDVLPRLEENEDAAATAHKALKSLELQHKSLANRQSPAVAAVVAPTPAFHELVSRLDSNESRLGLVEAELDNHDSRLDEIERAAERITDENEFKDEMMSGQISELNTKLDEMQRNSGNDVRDIRKELEDLDAWKDLQTHIQNLRSTLNDHERSTKTMIEELGRSMRLYVEEMRSSAKTEMEELKSSSTYTSQLLENHVDLLQRHEGRLNSVTTEELVRMMENQWRATFGAPDQLKGLTIRLGKLENFTRDTFKGLNPTVKALRTRVEGMAASAQARMTKIENDIQSCKYPPLPSARYSNWY